MKSMNSLKAWSIFQTNVESCHCGLISADDHTDIITALSDSLLCQLFPSLSFFLFYWAPVYAKAERRNSKSEINNRLGLNVYFITLYFNPSEVTWNQMKCCSKWSAEDHKEEKTLPIQHDYTRTAIISNNKLFLFYYPNN